VADIEIITNLEGLDELEKTLTSGSKGAVKRFLRAGEKKAARVIQAAAIDNAPELTGVLKENIKVSSSVSGDTLNVRVGPSPEAFYGIFQEFGTEFQPGQHWLSISFDESKDEALGVFLSEATDSLQEMAKR